MKAHKQSKLWEWTLRIRGGGQKCAKCGETKNLTVDHIVPVSWINQFIIMEELVAQDLETNFEILCGYCNRMKGARIDPREPRVYEVLEYVISKAKQEHLNRDKIVVNGSKEKQRRKD